MFYVYLIVGYFIGVRLLDVFEEIEVIIKSRFSL